MSQTVGQAINNLVSMLPQIMVMMIIYRLVFNELLHVVVEPVREPASLEDVVVEAVKHYNDRYGVAASVEDIGLHIYARPAREMVDRMLTKEKLDRVREIADKLVAAGKLRKSDSGYVA
jgi:hypothetical protein